MRWRVEITERNGDNRLLRDVLEPCSIRLHEEAGKLFLVGGPFEELETAGKVHALASRFQSIASEIGQADSDIPISFQVGHIWEELENGQLRGHVFLSARTAVFCFATTSLTFEGGQSLSEADQRRIKEEEKEREYQKKCRKAISRFVSALKDERALKAQRLLQKELSPQTMGHIADLIKDDGGAIKELVSRTQLERFYGSINNPVVFGDAARHIVSSQEPPRKPMTLEEARTFIRDLAARWLENKAGLPPSV